MDGPGAAPGPAKPTRPGLANRYSRASRANMPAPQRGIFWTLCVICAPSSLLSPLNSVRDTTEPPIRNGATLLSCPSPTKPGKHPTVITKRISTRLILANLQAKVDQRIPIMISSAGSGLVARLLEKCGTDCVNTFSGARLRANGMGTMAMMWPILDSNRQTLDYTREDIMPALEGKAFVCACLNANDPLKDMRMVLQECKDMGVQAVSNIGPSISYVDHDSEIFRVMKSAGITLENEIEMLKLAREEMEMVSIGLAFTLEDSIAICEKAAPHIFCFHAGTTKGGLSGYDKGMSVEETAAQTEHAFQKCREVHPDVILVAHGAAMESPADAQYMLDHTSGHGFWTGSSTERIPIERAVTEVASEFAGLRFSK